MNVLQIKQIGLTVDLTVIGDTNIEVDVKPGRENGAAFYLNRTEAAALRDWLTIWLAVPAAPDPEINPA